MAKAAGVNWVRLHDAGTEYIGWAHLEPQKGQWQFRDADLQRYRERYLEPLRMDDWANAVRTIVSRHRGRIDTYEIWNEPWGSGFWGIKPSPQPGRDELLPSDTPSKDYARLQKVAYDAAHEVFSEVTILGFNTCDSETGTKWTKDVLDFGGIDTCDAVSYHHYETGLTGFPNDPVEKACRAALGPILEKVGRVPKPVWMSEGAPLAGDVSNGFYRYTLPYENHNDNWRIADFGVVEHPRQ